MDIKYETNSEISVLQFVELLQNCALGERRPLDDSECLAGMLANSNLTVSAWASGQLVGIARSMTDFHYACYLSDLAVHQNYQRLGIGKQLQRLTQQQLGPLCKLILVAAPDADTYYGHVGYSSNPRCWVLDREQPIKDCDHKTK